MVRERPEIVKAFIEASIEGWRSYMENPAPGNALIRKEKRRHSPRTCWIIRWP